MSLPQYDHTIPEITTSAPNFSSLIWHQFTKPYTWKHVKCRIRKHIDVLITGSLAAVHIVSSSNEEALSGIYNEALKDGMEADE